MCGQRDLASTDLTTHLPNFHPASAGLVVMGGDLGAACMHIGLKPLAPSGGGGTVESEVCWLD